MATDTVFLSLTLIYSLFHTHTVFEYTKADIMLSKLVP